MRSLDVVLQNPKQKQKVRNSQHMWHVMERFSHSLLVEMPTDLASKKIIKAASQEVKARTLLLSSNFTLPYVTQEHKN